MQRIPLRALAAVMRMSTMADIINTRPTVLAANCWENGRCFWRSAIQGREIPQTKRSKGVP